MICGVCRQDTVRTPAGLCAWCHPVVYVAPLSCRECDREFTASTRNGNQSFCSARCRNRAWERTEAGRAWLAVKNARGLERKRLARLAKRGAVA